MNSNIDMELEIFCMYAGKLSGSGMFSVFAVCFQIIDEISI